MSSERVARPGRIDLVENAIIRAWIVSAIVFSVVFFGYVIYQRVFSPLAKIKGPFWASLTSLWKAFAIHHGDYHETVLRLHQKYGKIVRIAPDEVIISDKSAISEIYNNRPGKEYLKTTYYDAFTPAKPTIFSQRDPHLHAQRKRLVSQGYSMNAIQPMEGYVQERIRIFLDKLTQFSKSHEEVDLGKWCHFFAFDVIGDLAFSEGFGMLESGIEDDHIALINKHFEFSATVGSIPWILPYLQWTFLPIPLLKTLKSSRAKLVELARSRVERRKERPSDRKDLLGRLLGAKDPVTGQGLDSFDLRTEAFSAIVAGSDSTSSALAYIFYHILNHPDVYERLTKEIREEFPEIDEKSDLRLPNYTELGKLPYLQACIKESLRLNPPATINLPRYVPEPGRTIAGVYFPPKTVVGMSAVPVHLDRDNFGPDADIFNPDRWIKETGDLSIEELQRAWIPFGHGTRQCIGKNVALMEITKLVGTILLNFDLENAQGRAKQLEIPRSKSYFNARLQDPLKVYVHAR